jgi:hypothetical protein
MKDSIRQRLEKMSDRFEEVGRLLATTEVAGSSQQFRDLSMEYARLQPLAEALRGYHDLERDLATARELLEDQDAGMRSLGAEEVEQVQRALSDAEGSLRLLLLPKDSRDDRNIYLEIRAGTGGDEAAIFAGDLYRMYARYAESRGWAVEVLSESPGEHGGHREIISRIVGRGARRPPRRRAASTPPPARSPSCPSSMRWTTSRSTRRICVLTPSAPLGLAVSTSTRPTRLCASRTCPRGSWWSARTSAPSTRTARAP